MRESDYYLKTAGTQASATLRPADAGGDRVAEAPFGAPPHVPTSCGSTNRNGSRCKAPLDQGVCRYHG